MGKRKPPHGYRYALLITALLFAATSQAQSVLSSSELIELYSPSHAPDPTKPRSRSIDIERGIGGIRNSQANTSNTAKNGVSDEPETQIRQDKQVSSSTGVGAQGSTEVEQVNFHNIVFDSSSFSILGASYRQLDEIGSALAVLTSTFPEIGFVIEGHTDSLGDAQTNRTLSFNRANTIKRYLTFKFSINADQLEAVGFGESQPMESNTTREGRARNRRVSISKKNHP